jgi:hypothetical protein
MRRVAQCHCGQLRVTVTGEPNRVYLCHCIACQRRTGSPFHHGARWRKEEVQVQGEHRIYARTADSGFENRFHFCPNCGSNVFWEGYRAPDFCGVTVGAFGDPHFPAPTISIFEESLHDWLGFTSVIERLEGGFPMVMPAKTQT